jgi:hypothetical protein
MVLRRPHHGASVRPQIADMKPDPANKNPATAGFV